jgi:transposase
MSGLSISPYFPFVRFKVTRQVVHENSALIDVAPDERFCPLCHACSGRAQTVHSSGYRRFIRDLGMSGKQVTLQVLYRKVWCGRCGGARVEEMGFCEASSRITCRLARFIYELCKIMTVLDVARHLELDPKTVKAVEKAFLKQEHGKENYHDLRVLVIDEIAIRRGHCYLTVIADYLTGRIVSVEPGRNKETLDSFFTRLTPLQKERIEAVAVDMWEAYINRIRHHCPQAMIVFDFFHVVRAYGEVVKDVRREEWRVADRQQRQYFRGSEYILLKNADNLSESQADRLERLLKVNRTLHAVYTL